MPGHTNHGSGIKLGRPFFVVVRDPWLALGCTLTSLALWFMVAAALLAAFVAAAASKPAAARAKA